MRFFACGREDGCFAAPAASRCCACGRKLGRFVPRREQVLRLRARDGEFRAPARVTFFFCKKKVTKENHSNLRFKDPLARGGFRRCGGELAFPWRGGGLRRPHFFLRRKKCGKESRLDLRSKGPLARGGQVQIWRCWLRGIGAVGDVVGSGIACTACAAAADNSEGRGWYAGRFWRLSNRAFGALRRQR